MAMTIPIEQATINLAVALALSAVIGLERQWRNRLAGLRTNTLVALGAATFVIFAALIPGEASPTQVAAQVVSGIGFLGTGLIFREGQRFRRRGRRVHRRKWWRTGRATATAPAKNADGTRAISQQESKAPEVREARLLSPLRFARSLLGGRGGGQAKLIA
jgi:MgtC family